VLVPTLNTEHEHCNWKSNNNDFDVSSQFYPRYYSRLNTKKHNLLKVQLSSSKHCTIGWLFIPNHCLLYTISFVVQFNLWITAQMSKFNTLFSSFSSSILTHLIWIFMKCKCKNSLLVNFYQVVEYCKEISYFQMNLFIRLE